MCAWRRMLPLVACLMGIGLLACAWPVVLVSVAAPPHSVALAARVLCLQQKQVREEVFVMPKHHCVYLKGSWIFGRA